MSSSMKQDMGHQSHGGNQHKATFSGITAMIGVIAMIMDIVSVAVPQWGSFRPGGQQYYSSGVGGYVAQDNTGHFGPFQSCKYTPYYSYCGGDHYYNNTTWIVGAGIAAVLGVLSLAVFSLFAILHVAMQLQRREIMVAFTTAVFIKVVASSVAAVATIIAVILGGIHFAVGGRNNSLRLDMGVMYYIQIILIFVAVLLVILSYLSWRKCRRHPINLVPRGEQGAMGTGAPYEIRNGNGVTMTASSGQPYQVHGQPRFPNQPQPQSPYLNKNYLQQQQQQYIDPSSQGYSNNGFVHQVLSVPSSSSGSVVLPQQAVPMQPIKPIQPVQGIPQSNPQQLGVQVLPHIKPSVSPVMPQPSSHPVAPSPVQIQPGGVSFAPGGKTGTGGVNMGFQAGSMDSLNTINSTLSFGSTISTECSLSSSANDSMTSSGMRRSILKQQHRQQRHLAPGEGRGQGHGHTQGSGHGPLRSSLKKPKNKEGSINSDVSSKRVRLSLGTEQTSV